MDRQEIYSNMVSDFNYKNTGELWRQGIYSLALCYRLYEEKGDQLTLNHFDGLVIDSVKHAVFDSVIIEGVVK